jgi:2-desacetyl-2-hydroxyethyl bacteriochlorophyllide A dehydrogenase
MKALYFCRPGQAEIRDIPEPQPGPDEVLVRVRASGICGTDLHVYDDEWPAEFPLIPGHEFAGEVGGWGDEVKDLQLGQGVACSPCVYCGQCTYCRSLQLNFCENLLVYGGSLPGGFAEYVTVKRSCVFPCDGLSLDEASVIEPISCGVHAFSHLGRLTGGKVLLFGCGTQGLILLQLSRLAGAASIAAVDLYPAKLALAERMGARLTALADDPALPKHLAQAGPFDLVIDATGVPRVVEGLIQYVRNAGSLLYFGVCPPHAHINLNPYEVFRRELKIYGSFSLSGEFEAALRLAQSGAVDVKSLITHRLPLDDFLHGLELMRRPAESAKIVITP